MSKDKNMNFRDDFRPALKVNVVAELQKKNPGRTYCHVRFDDLYDPNNMNVEYYQSKGWVIETDTQALKDDRTSHKASESQDSLRASPLTKKGKGGATFVLMSIDNETLKKNEANKVKENMDRFLASSTGRKAVKKGGQIEITDSEVNESNTKLNSEE